MAGGGGDTGILICGDGEVSGGVLYIKLFFSEIRHAPRPLNPRLHGPSPGSEYAHWGFYFSLQCMSEKYHI